MPSLPLEIILLIIEAIPPASPGSLLSAKNEITKTLLSLTKVCKALYGPAAEALRRHCVYLDTRERTKTFRRCLQLSPPSFIKEQDTTYPGLRDVKNMFLASFPYHDGFRPLEEVISPELRARVDGLDNVVPPELLEASPSTSPASDVSSNAPRPSSPLDDLDTAMALYDVLHAVAPSLRRLVIDIPLRTLWPDNDVKSVKKVLWRAFEALENLEEFTSIRDEFFFYALNQQPWDYNAWPKLRRLSLYNPDTDHEVATRDTKVTLYKRECFELLVYGRADGLFEGVELLRNIYSGSAAEGQVSVCPSLGELTVVHIDVEAEPMDWLEESSLPRLRFVNKLLKVPEGQAFAEDPSTWPVSPAVIVQDWILERSLEGTLWERAISKSTE